MRIYMTIRFLTAACLVVFCACVPPKPPALTPTALHSQKSPIAAVQAAAQALAAANFDITSSDANGGIIVASRTRRLTKVDGSVVCRIAVTDDTAFGLLTELQITLIAKQVVDGSDVSINSKVLSAMTKREKLGASFASEDDCASTGKVEAAVASALR